MAENLPDLARQYQELVRALVKAHVPDAQVWVFGSRATGRARPYSDLDLLFTRPEHLPWQSRCDLQDALEASELPFRVDIVETRSLTPPLRLRIEAERLAL